MRPAFSGYANHAIWAGVVDTGSGYQAVNGNWYEPCITAYGHRTEFDAWAWVGVGGAYSIVSNEGVLVQAGTESTFFSDGSQDYEAFVEVVNDATNANYEIDFTLSNQAKCDDYMSTYVSSNYDYPGYNYFFVQEVTRISYYSCSPDSCPCTQNCQSTNPAHAPVSNGSSAEWIIERNPNDALAKFATSNCTASSTCLTFDDDYVYRNNQKVSIGVDPETAVTMYDYSTNPATELAFPGPVHNNNFFNEYWLTYK